GMLVGNVFMAAPGGDAFFAPVSAAAGGGFLAYADTQATSPGGPISGTSFVSAARDFMFFESNETTFPNERSFLFAGVPTPSNLIPTSGFGAWDIRRDFVANSNVPFIPAATGGNLSNAVVGPALIGFTSNAVRPFL